MAYDYSKAYEKRRAELIKTRRELSKMGVPLTSLPSLPKKSKNVTKEVAKQMRDIYRETKSISRAEKYIKNHPTVTREERLEVQEKQRQRELKRKKEYRRRKKEDNPELIDIYTQNFEERIMKIPKFTGRNGKAYFGRDIILKWWRTLKSSLSEEQIYKILRTAEDRGEVLSIEYLYEEASAIAYVDSMMEITKDVLSEEDYEELKYEMNWSYERDEYYED